MKNAIRDEGRILLSPLKQWNILFLECLGLLLGGFLPHADKSVAWLVQAGFVFALLIALWAWWRAFTRSRTISNTPGERIASAAQGYSRLTGRGQPLGGEQIYLPGTGVPCLWYRAIISTYSYNYFGTRRRADQIETDESDGSFLIDDGSGAVCAVDPDGAEIRVQRYRSHAEGDTKIKCWYLMPGDRIEVLGEFFTLGSIDADLNTSRQIGELLESWKSNRPDLLRRFDQDGDGELTMEEWELARAAARQEVERAQREALAEPQAHLMRKPKDGSPYLISDRSLDDYARQLWFWSIAHGLIFVAAAAALAWFSTHGGELPDALKLPLASLWPQPHCPA